MLGKAKTETAGTGTTTETATAAAAAAQPAKKAVAGASDKPPAASTTPTAAYRREMNEELGFELTEETDASRPPNATKPGEEPEAAGAEKEPKPETEATEEPETEKPEGEETAEHTDAADTKLSEAAQKALDKRIGKEVAKRKALEEELAAERAAYQELKGKLDETEASRDRTAAETPATVLSHATEADLEKREDELWRWERFCERHPEGYEGQGEADKSYSAEELREIKLQAREERERWIPARREQLRRQADLEPKVLEAYPDLKDPRSELSLEVARLVRTLPGLRARADHRMLAADLAAGIRARLGKTNAPAATASPAATRRAPPAPAAGSASSKGGATMAKPKRSEIFARGKFTDEALAEAFQTTE